MKKLQLLIFLIISSISYYAQTNPEWFYYNTLNSSLPINIVNCMAVDSNNTVWVGTYQGLASFDGETWKLYNKSNGLISKHVSAIAIDRQNKIWIMDSLLSAYDGTKWIHYPPSIYPHAPVETNLLAIDSNNIKWLGLPDPWFSFESNGIISFNDTVFTIYNRNKAVYTLNTYNNEKWIGTYVGVEKYDDSVWSNPSGHYFEVDALAIDNKGTIWITGYRTIMINPDSYYEVFYRSKLERPNNWSDIENILPDGTTESIVTDDIGNVWFAMNSVGLYKYNENDSTCILFNNSNSGLQSNGFYTMIIDKNGNLWIAQDKGITVYRKGGVILNIVDKNDDEFPLTYKLEQNYPNPFNPTTKINYSVPQLSVVTLKIFDVLGNEVTTLVNEEKPAGNYEVVFDGNNLPSGVYFYRMQAGNFTETKKFVLLK